MKKLFLLAVGLGAALAVSRRADKLGISPKAVVLGGVQHWLNQLSGRTQPVPAEAPPA
jgi:hypothetical protein